LSQVHRALVVRLDQIGDVVLTIPFLRELRRNLPAADITLVVAPAAKELFVACPYVNDVIGLEPEALATGRIVPRALRAARASRRHGDGRGFDLAIAPRWGPDTYGAAVVAYASRARWRVGHASVDGNAVADGYDRFFTHILCRDTVQHEVLQSLDLLRHIGGVVQSEDLELWTTADDDSYADGLLGGDRGRHIALGVGAGHPKRVWPKHNFEALGLELLRRGHPLVLVGGQEDLALGQYLKARLGSWVTDACGSATLTQTAAVLRRCRLFVGNDAGPMHIAAAMGTPVVEVSCHPQDGGDAHANSPVRFGPWSVPNRVSRPPHSLDPCSGACEASESHCISQITADQVAEAVQAIMKIEEPKST
jgi:heptosyltransferase-2